MNVIALTPYRQIECKQTSTKEKIQGWQYRIKRNQYVKNNCYFDVTTCEAYSYGWWRYVERINGKVIFNSYRYSPSTARHQRETKALLNKLGIPIDIEIEAPQGLQNLQSAIDYYEHRIDELSSAIAKPRSRKAANAERARQIAEYRKKIAVVRKLMARQG